MSVQPDDRDPDRPAGRTGPGTEPDAGPDPALRADCGDCFGLCCVALTLTASADFPADKDAGEPCRHLGTDFRCGIHRRLREQGYRGCTVYDCFGAGQKVSRITFGGQDWRREPGSAERMFAVLPVMRQLHELLWYLGEALTLEPARPLHDELREALAGRPCPAPAGRRRRSG